MLHMNFTSQSVTKHAGTNLNCNFADSLVTFVSNAVTKFIYGQTALN